MYEEAQGMDGLLRMLRDWNASLMGSRRTEVLRLFEASYGSIVGQVEQTLEVRDNKALEALTLMWRSMDQTGHEEDGVRLLTRALTLNNAKLFDRGFGSLGLGTLLLKQGRLNDALDAARASEAAFKEQQKIDDTNTRPEAKSLDLQGKILVRLGEAERGTTILLKAEGILDELLEREHPSWRDDQMSDSLRTNLNDLAEVNTHLSEAYQLAGDPDEARRRKDRARELYRDVGNTIADETDEATD